MAPTFGPGRDPGDLGSNPTSGSWCMEPDVGFDPGSPESRPGPKAGAKLLRHPGIPTVNVYIHKVTISNSFFLSLTSHISIGN